MSSDASEAWSTSRVSPCFSQNTTTLAAVIRGGVRSTLSAESRAVRKKLAKGAAAGAGGGAEKAREGGRVGVGGGAEPAPGRGRAAAGDDGCCDEQQENESAVHGGEI